jgi:mannose-6-phosphate isomerase-like protein (cupin superfamily)
MTDTNWSHVSAGPASEWKRWTFDHPKLGRVPGKMFLQEALGLTGMEISLSVIGPGRGIPFLHRHRAHEEVYVFLSGSGEFQVDGVRFPVSEGSVVRVAPAGARAYRNTGDVPMAFACIQATAGGVAASTISDGEPLPDPVKWD